MDGILENNKDAWNVPVSEKQELVALANRYAICTAALRNHFEKETRKLFQSGTFKSNWLKHAILMSDSLNPRHTWCFSGESYMSVCKQLMFSCLKGRGALASSQKFMYRYVIAVTLQLNQGTWRIKWFSILQKQALRVEYSLRLFAEISSPVSHFRFQFQ